MRPSVRPTKVMGSASGPARAQQEGGEERGGAGEGKKRDAREDVTRAAEKFGVGRCKGVCNCDKREEHNLG